MATYVSAFMVVPSLRNEMPALPNMPSNPVHTMIVPLCFPVLTQNLSSNLLPEGLLTLLIPPLTSLNVDSSMNIPLDHIRGVQCK